MSGAGIVTRDGAARRRRSEAETVNPEKEAPGCDLHRSQDGDAGWSSPVARQAHNLKVVGSNPTPATNKTRLYAGFFVARMI